MVRRLVQRSRKSLFSSLRPLDSTISRLASRYDALVFFSPIASALKTNKICFVAQYEKRVAEKRRQLTGDSSSLTMPSVVETPTQPSLKRARSAPSGNQSDC